MLILLADDDEELRFILSRVLRKEGYQVEEIGDCVSLTQRLEHHIGRRGETSRVALVSDVYMPGGDAITAVEALKVQLGDLPIIFITSARDEKISEQGRQLGAKAVLSKPVDMDALRHLLRQIADPS